MCEKPVFQTPPHHPSQLFEPPTPSSHPPSPLPPLLSAHETRRHSDAEGGRADSRLRREIGGGARLQHTDPAPFTTPLHVSTRLVSVTQTMLTPMNRHHYSCKNDSGHQRGIFKVICQVIALRHCGVKYRTVNVTSNNIMEDYIYKPQPLCCRHTTRTICIRLSCNLIKSKYITYTSSSQVHENFLFQTL